MDNGFLKTTNAINVIVSIYLPLIIAFCINTKAIKSNPVLLCVYIIVLGIAYLGSLIQGIHLIANAMARTSASAAVFRMIMYTLLLIGTYKIKPLVIILAILILFAVIRFIISRKCMADDNDGVGSPKTAVIVTLITIVLPIALTAVVMFATKFLNSHPDVKRVFSMIAAVVILLVVVGVAWFVLSFLVNILPSSSSGYDTGSYKSSAGSSDGSKKRKLQAEYERAEEKYNKTQRNYEAAKKSNFDGFSYFNCGANKQDLERSLAREKKDMDFYKDRLNEEE